jgi:hypothetical protein
VTGLRSRPDPVRPASALYGGSPLLQPRPGHRETRSGTVRRSRGTRPAAAPLRPICAGTVPLSPMAGELPSVTGMPLWSGSSFWSSPRSSRRSGFAARWRSLTRKATAWGSAVSPPCSGRARREEHAGLVLRSHPLLDSAPSRRSRLRVARPLNKGLRPAAGHACPQCGTICRWRVGEEQPSGESAAVTRTSLHRKASAAGRASDEPCGCIPDSTRARQRSQLPKHPDARAPFARIRRVPRARLAPRALRMERGATSGSSPAGRRGWLASSALCCWDW